LKIAFLIHNNAPFSHRNIMDGLLEEYPHESIQMTFEQYLENQTSVDWVILIDHYKIRSHYKEIKSKLAIWTLEDTYEIDSNLNIHHDVLFTNDEGAISIRKEHNQNVYLLPLACRKSIFKPKSLDNVWLKPRATGDNDKYELIMVGNAFSNRVNIVNKLIEFIQENKIIMHIYGINWDKAKISCPYIFMHNNLISETELAHLYNSSEMALEINRELHNQNTNKVKAITPGRGFNSLGCTCFTITDYRETSTKYFPESGIAYCKNMEDIKRNIMLNRFEKRKSAKIGHEAVYQNHTFANRIENIMDILK